MIRVTRLNGEVFFINPEKIEFIEETPDTLISMESGRKLVVLESSSAIQDSIIAYRRAVYLGLPLVHEREPLAPI